MGRRYFGNVASKRFQVTLRGAPGRPLPGRRPRLPPQPPDRRPPHDPRQRRRAGDGGARPGPAVALGRRAGRGGGHQPVADRPADGGRGAGARPDRAGRSTTSSAGAARPRPPTTSARSARLATLAHESFDGALVVKTLGRAAHEEAPSRRRRRPAPHERAPRRPPPRRLRARARRPAEPRHHRPVWRIGTWRLSEGAVTTGELVAGHGPVRLLTLPDAGASASSSSSCRARSCRVDRLDEVLDTSPRRSPTVGPHRPARGPLGVRSTTWASRTPRARLCSTASASRCAPGEVVALDRSHRVGQEHALLPARPPHRPVDRVGRRSAAST